MKIVFMGTPIYSASILENLISSSHDVVGILTKPDTSRGRSGKLVPSPVKQLALEHKIPLFQPSTLKNNTEIVTNINQLNAEIGIVVAYGLILPEFILSIFPSGCLNIHPSLLPKYRGSSPVSASILNGDTMTGISIMKLNSGIDSGPILSQKEVNIAKNETCEDLTTRLFSLSSKILIEVINKIEKGKITQKEQCEKEATYTKKLSRLDGLINWENSASEISNMIRAYHPWPGSYTVLNGRKLKIIESEFLISKHIKTIAPGEIFVDKEVFVGTSDGIIKLIKIQPEGKPVMNAKDFSNGNHAFRTSILGNR